LTGETGAGKSVVLHALRAVAGGRASAETIAPGASAACIEATFRSTDPRIAPWRQSQGIEPLDPACPETIVLAREIGTATSRCRVDGRLVTQSALRELGDVLIEMCGQHDQVRLGQSAEQLRALDAYAGAGELREQCKATFDRLQAAEVALRCAREAAVSRAQQLELWEFQRDEIDSAALASDDEPAQLATRAQILSQTQALGLTAQQADEGLQDNAAALGQTTRRIRAAAAWDARLTPIADQLAEAAVLVEDARRELRRYAEGLDGDAEALPAVEARRETLNKILRKYGPTVADARALRERLEHDLQTAAADDRLAHDCQVQVELAIEHLAGFAHELSRARHQAAPILQSALQAELADLGMSAARLEIRLVAREGGPGPEGLESVELLFAPGGDESLRPLGKIASGGELSRCMLALKVAMASVEPVGTLVFDEIDTGISGNAAQAVASKLKRLSDRQQVLLVTHLPAIAAIADQHVQLRKEKDSGRSTLHAAILDHDGRIRELAHLMSGRRDSKAAGLAAAELLARARQRRSSAKRSEPPVRSESPR
ncbi:MAG: DNA repair protein RecN, partial [Cyanobacteria bacterium REEB65]|nr:DNA repair protein RecN [Cyanobacteria bacterium REEB65]